jgi:hypothetical protein
VVIPVYGVAVPIAPDKQEDNRRGAIRMIEGFATAGYFNIRCAKCKRETLNEYLGYDPSMPVIRTTCSTCKTTHDYKVHTGNWRGLPRKAEPVS